MEMSPTQVEFIRKQGATLVVVAVCTHLRPKMLWRCLNSLSAQEISADIIPYFLVVDNDKEGSAGRVYDAWAKGHSRQTAYVIEPERGIAKARNKAVQFAIDNLASYLCFIDDDAIAPRFWLQALMNPAYRHVPILGGEVRMRYHPTTPDWLKDRIRPAVEGDGKVTGMGTARLDMKVFEHGLRFNEALRCGGGEDGQFLIQARLAGFATVRTTKAYIIEYAHPERYTIWGRLQYAHWVAAANMREEVAKYGRAKAIWYRSGEIIFAVPTAIVQLIEGLARFTIASFKRRSNPMIKAKRKLLRAGRTIAVMHGRVAGIFGIVPQTYAKTVGE